MPKWISRGVFDFLIISITPFFSRCVLENKHDDWYIEAEFPLQKHRMSSSIFQFVLRNNPQLKIQKMAHMRYICSRCMDYITENQPELFQENIHEGGHIYQSTSSQEGPPKRSIVINMVLNQNHWLTMNIPLLDVKQKMYISFTLTWIMNIFWIYPRTFWQTFYSN